MTEPTIPDVRQPKPEASQPKGPKMFGEGGLSVATNGIYRALSLTVLMIVAALPTVLLMLLPLFFDQETPSLLMPGLMVLACIPLGSALSAGLYSLRAASTEEGLTPIRTFWRGYRQNAVDVLKVWVPPLLFLAVIAVTVTWREMAGLGVMYLITLTFIAALLLVWAHHAVALVTFFTFRPRDVYRLAVYCLVTQWRATFGVIAILVVLGVVVYLYPVLALFLGGIWVWFWWRNIQEMLQDVLTKFTVQPGGKGDPSTGSRESETSAGA